MANPDISPVVARQFSSMVHVAAQQTQSRLKSLCKVMPIKGQDAAYDGLGEIAVSNQNSKYQSISFSAPVWNRRKLAVDRFYVAIPIDELDKLQTILNPEMEYHKIVAAEMNRKIDRIVAAAALADVLTGANFGTTVDFATDNGLTVDSTSGLTYSKLLEIQKNFTNRDVGTDSPVRKTLLITGDEEAQLMGEAELTSGDFSRQFAVEKGEMVKAAGFDLIKFGASATSPVLNVATTTRSCLALAQNAIALGIQKDINVYVEKRTDLLETWQIVATGYIGAVRTEGKLIQKVTTTVAS